MIKSREYQALFMDYSSMYGDKYPSDIDMVYLCNDGFLILGEIKNIYGEFKPAQKNVYVTIMDTYNKGGKGGMVLYIVHDKFVQYGDKVVDVPSCEVKKYYFKGKWHYPRQKLLVKDVLQKYM